MGRKSREHRERVIAGLENPIARKAVAVAARGSVIQTLQQASTDEQIDVLSQAAARTRPSKVRDALMRNAPREMDKAIRDFLKQGKPVTVETLTEEARNTPTFVAMCSQVGLEMSWFEELARERMKVAYLERVNGL